jgi:hypothetical protein
LLPDLSFAGFFKPCFRDAKAANIPHSGYGRRAPGSSRPAAIVNTHYEITVSRRLLSSQRKSPNLKGKGIHMHGKFPLISAVLLIAGCTSAFAASCPAGSTQLTSTTAGGRASSAATWGGTPLGTGDGMCLIVQGPVLLDQDLGTSVSGKGVYTIIQSGSGSLTVDSSASRHIYFASKGSDPVGTGTAVSPGADATMYGFLFFAGTLSLTGTQANPVIINSADGLHPWYVAHPNTGWGFNFSVTIKWCDCSNLGTNVAGFNGVYVDTTGFSAPEVIDIENSRFTSPYQVVYVFGNGPGQGALKVMNNIVTGRRGPATISGTNGNFVSPVIENNTESAPLVTGYFTYVYSLSGPSITYVQNTVAGTATAAIGNLALGGDLSGSGVVANNLTYNDPAQAGSAWATGLNIAPSGVFTGAIDSNYCEGCFQGIVIRGRSPAAALTVSNNFGVTNHLAYYGQGIYFISGGSVTLTGNIGVITDAAGVGAEVCIFGYTTGTALAATNNTCHSVTGPATFSFGIVIGEPGYPVSNARVASNLVSGFQHALIDGDPGNKYTNTYAGAGVYQNNLWNAGTAYQSAGSLYFDNGIQRHANAAYGDLTLDPQYFDPTRLSLATYDLHVLGGPGTVADVIAKIGYRSGWGVTYLLGNNPAADALTWFRDGFTPSNAAVCPGGVTTGAMPCAAATLSLSPATLPAATPGASYSQTLTANGGSNCTFSVAGVLPPGLTLNFTGTSNIATISGIPSGLGGLYSLVIGAACWNGSASLSATINVVSPPSNVASPPFQQTDVSTQVSVTTSGLVSTRGLVTLAKGTVTITNIGSTPIATPIQSVFTNLKSTIVLTNKTGTISSAGPYAGAPFITVPILNNSSLAPGASVTFPVQFVYVGTAPISYVSKTLSGGF